MARAPPRCSPSISCCSALRSLVLAAALALPLMANVTSNAAVQPIDLVDEAAIDAPYLLRRVEQKAGGEAIEVTGRQRIRDFLQ